MSTRTEIRRRHFDLGGIFHAAADRHPDLFIHLDHQMECTTDAKNGLTLREAVSLVDALTERLHTHGLVPGAVVMVWHRDGFDLPLLASAVSRVGAVPAMLSPHLSIETVVELFSKLRASAVVSDAQGARALRPLLPVGTQFFVTDPTAGLIDLDDQARPTSASPQPAPWRPHKFEPNHPILITHTSGTTRLPKLALHSGRSLWYRIFPQQMISLLLSSSAPALISVTLVHTRFFGALGMFFWRGKPFIVARNTDLESIATLLCTHRRTILRRTPTPSSTGNPSPRTHDGLLRPSRCCTPHSTRSTRGLCASSWTPATAQRRGSFGSTARPRLAPQRASTTRRAAFGPLSARSSAGPRPA